MFYFVVSIYLFHTGFYLNYNTTSEVIAYNLPMLIGNGIQVFDVKRDGARAIHYTSEALDVDSEVTMVVDWERRFDHMQQHTGQHLITAVFDNKFGYKTVSWSLQVGPENKCFIELDTNKLTTSQMREVEQECNKLIYESRPIHIRLLEKDSEEFSTVRSRGLPSDHAGPIRVVDIEGVDVNMCCGTHMSNLNHLKSIKLLHYESKGSANTLVYYIVGERIRYLLDRMYHSERALNKALCCGPQDYITIIDKMTKQQKSAHKQIKTYLKEIATLISEQVLKSPNPTEYYVLHRDDADTEFMNVICSQLGSVKKLILLTGGCKGAGIYMLNGAADVITSVVPNINSILKGKGGGRGNRYQGKAEVIENYKLAFEVIITYFTK